MEHSQVILAHPVPSQGSDSDWDNLSHFSKMLTDVPFVTIAEELCLSPVKSDTSHLENGK